ncbi:MAG: hypothetical protein QOJ13_446 [Gaiellales bacterium]|nr:hypothetical protein [Gaiellales bacterium]
MGDPRAVIEGVTDAQNAHDLEAMLAWFHDDYLSEQPIFPSRAFRGVDQVRKNWSTLLASIPDFHSEVVRTAVDGDTIFAEVHWTGTRTDGSTLEERGVMIMGVRDDRVAWGRLFIDEVDREGVSIDRVVKRMAGTDEPP